jgi:hypothetical protein
MGLTVCPVENTLRFRARPNLSAAFTLRRPDAPPGPAPAGFGCVFGGLARPPILGVFLAPSIASVDAGRICAHKLTSDAPLENDPMKPKITRRHLIKGALATPLVLTVRSAAGTGTAMTSAGACRIQDKDRYEYDKPDKFKRTPDADEWLRKECRIVKLEKKVGYNKWERMSGEYFKGDSGHYWQLVRSGDQCDVYPKTECKEPDYRECEYVRKEYGLVCVDEWGYPKGWAWEKPHHSPITCSCWASLKLT